MATKKRAVDTVLNITGVPSGVEEDYIEHHFTKKCRELGGGEVEVLSVSESDSTAVVSIKQLSSEAKQKLLSMEHKLLRTQICVSECDRSDEEVDNSTSSSQCTVTVQGFHYSDKEEAIDCLELYFGQDRKGSGGGEIVEDGIQIVKGRGIITFADNKVAQRVVSNSPHNVMGQELRVVFAEEESASQELSNLLLKNIPPGTDDDYLELFIDNVTGLSASDGDYQLLPKPGGLYVVAFNSAPEAELSTIITKISKKKIKKQFIEVEVMSPSTRVVLSNVIDTKRSEEFLSLYFTNPKHSGVSGYDDIELLDDGRVMVHLQDQKSVEAVLQAKHHKLGPDVKLQLYDQFSVPDEVEPNSSTQPETPTPSDIKDEPSVPPSPISRKMSHVMAHYVQNSNPPLTKLLDKFHVTVNIDIDDESEVGFIHILPSVGSERVKNWNEECEATIELFLKSLNSSSLPVQPQLLPKIQEIVEENTSLCIKFARDNTTLHIAGDSSEVAKLVREVKYIEDTELTRKESISFDAKRVAYIQAQADELREDNPDISFEVNIADNTIIVTGKKEDVSVFKQVLKQIKFSSVVVPFVGDILNYLFSTEDRTVINKLIEEQDDSCVPYFDQESNKLYVLGSDRAVTNTLAKYLLQSISCEAIKNSGKATTDKQFLALCEQMKEDNDVYIEILPDEIKIIGRSQHAKAVIQTLEEYIQKEYFGKRKIELNKGRWRFISQHLKQQWDKITEKLSSSQYKDVMAQFPLYANDNPVILLEGEQLLISALQEEINALISSVCTNDPPMLINRPGLFQFLNTKQAEFTIKGIEASVPAYIEITIKALQEADEVNDENIRTTNEVLKGTTKEGKRVILIKGEIENLKVDVIVNAANNQLSHGSGVALALSKKGGPKIQKDSANYIRTHGIVLDGDAVMREEVGNLPCKRMIYAVGPVWHGGTHYEDRMLRKACIKSLRLAQNYESISFPAISSGLFKFPLHVCADTMIHAFCTWSEEFPNVVLRDMYVVVHDHAVQPFSDAVKKHLTVFSQDHLPTASVVSAPVNPALSNKKKRKKHKGNTSTSDDVVTVPAVTASIGIGNAKPAPIKVYKGELLKQQADAYVNTTSNDLVLSNGVVSKSILNAAGQTLQDECSKHVSNNGRLQAGDVVVTGAGNIPCKHIIHTSGSNYDSSNASNSEKVLEQTVQNCLKACDQRKVTSIAFPALGAGALGYPSKVVARVMVTAVQKYFQTSTTSIQAVKFVIFMDDTFQEFQSFLSSQNTSTLADAKVPASMPDSMHSTYQPGPSSFTYPSSFVAPSSSIMPSPSSLMTPSLSTSQPSSEMFKTGSITVEVVCGDITDDDSDVIVNTTQSDLRLDSGAVSKAISRKAGPAMQQSCSLYIQQHKQLDDGKVCITDATGQLRCKKVFHIVVPGSKKASIINQTIMLCLKEAERNQLKSIAIPAIGTGGLSYKPGVAAQGMCEAIIEFGVTQPVHVQQVRIVIFLKDMYQLFVQKFNEISTGQSAHSQPNRFYRYFSNAVSYFTGGGKSDGRSGYEKLERPEVVDRPYTPPLSHADHLTTSPLSISISSPRSSQVLIKVFAKDEKAVCEAEDQLLDIINQHCEALPVDDPRIVNLRPDQISQLAQKAEELNVSIEVEMDLCRIQLRGGKNDVQIIKSLIDRMLHELDTEKLKTEGNATAASLMQKKIKWQYQIDDEQFEDYDPQINYQIETAYQLYKSNNHGPVFAFRDGNVNYEIIFDSFPMQEKDSGGLLTDIQRIDIEDKIKDMLKKAEFPSTWGQYDDNPQTKVVLLDPKDEEYLDIKKGFDITVGGKRAISKIERIQNPTLYAQYAARKKLMDQTNPPKTMNERRLYHGCGGDVVQNIIHGGFNRSYAGKNATAYGAGVYFAVNASYSSSGTYSPPDANGDKHIFLGLVLTGEYTVGNSSLRVPPAKDPKKSDVILFDSVVDNLNKPNMFVIFYDAQCYPEYLITFK